MLHLIYCTRERFIFLDGITDGGQSFAERSESDSGAALARRTTEITVTNTIGKPLFLPKGLDKISVRL